MCATRRLAGDNAQMMAVEQRARHLLNRRSTDKYRGAIWSYMGLSHGFRNGFFFASVRPPLLKASGIDHTGRALPAPP
ncbi:hypothetical protein KCP71_05325 [Salmonella enterica subsp. enterica]|nr:hypothetical protein KCP71_05325 [Salmonella enterica subsp. enterica]